MSFKHYYYVQLLYKRSITLLNPFHTLQTLKYHSITHTFNLLDIHYPLLFNTEPLTAHVHSLTTNQSPYCVH